MFPHVSILCPHAHFFCCMNMCACACMCPHVDVCTFFTCVLMPSLLVSSCFSSVCPHTVLACVLMHMRMCPYAYVHVSSYLNSDALCTKYLVREVVCKPFSLPGSDGGWLLVYMVFMYVSSCICTRVLMHWCMCPHAYVSVSSCICACPHT